MTNPLSVPRLCRVALVCWRIEPPRASRPGGFHR